MLFGVQVYFVRADRMLSAELSPNNPALHSGCFRHEDCPGITNLCEEDGSCFKMDTPICVCSQPMVVRCSDRFDPKRAKHTFCEQGCRVLHGAAQWL